MPLRPIDYQLLDAAKMGDLGALKALPVSLLNLDVSDDRVDSFGRKPIYWAAVGGHISVMEWLVAQGARIDAKRNDGGMLIHSAAFGGHISVMEWLVAHGASIDAKTNNGWMPIHSAAFGGHISVMEWLVAKGASIDGEMLIHVAAASDHIEVVKFLLDRNREWAGAALNDGRTPMDLTTDPAIKELLEETKILATPVVQKAIAKEKKAIKKAQDDLEMIRNKQKNVCKRQLRRKMLW